MTPSMHGTGVRSADVFVLPPRRRRIGAGAEQPAPRLLLMLAVAFLLASPVVTVLLAIP